MHSNSKLLLLLVWLWATLLPLASSQSGLKYSDVTFIGAHDSLMVRTKENGFSTFGNQFYDVTTQLNAGVRMVQGQGFIYQNEMHICHTSCDFLDGGRMVDHLNEIKTWLQQNPSEVVTLLWVNSDNLSPAEFDKVYKQAGMGTMNYIPSSTNFEDWPLISDMVSSGKRLVSFLAQGANQAMVPYLLDEFNYIFETPFQVTSSSRFGCNVDRGHNPAASLSLINHFLDDEITSSIVVPNASYASVTNSGGPGVGNLFDHITLCQQTFGRRVNFVLVDFFDRGNPFSVADKFNTGPPPTRVAPAPIAATDASGSAPSFLAAGSRFEAKESRFVAICFFVLLNIFFLL